MFHGTAGDRAAGGGMMGDNTDCSDVTEIAEREKLMQGLNGEARAKLENWLGLEPIDYEAPGSTARETGV